MKPNYLLCDMCGIKIPKDNSVFLEIGRDVYDNKEGYQVELCGKCWGVLAKKLKYEALLDVVNTYKRLRRRDA